MLYYHIKYIVSDNFSFIIDLHTLLSFLIYTIYFNSVKIFSFMCGKYYVHNVFYTAHRVAVV